MNLKNWSREKKTYESAKEGTQFYRQILQWTKFLMWNEKRCKKLVLEITPLCLINMWKKWNNIKIQECKTFSSDLGKFEILNKQYRLFNENKNEGIYFKEKDNILVYQSHINYIFIWKINNSINSQ